MILNRVKDYYKNDKEKLRKQARVNTEVYLKKKKKENMEETDTRLCLKKRNKN